MTGNKADLHVSATMRMIETLQSKKDIGIVIIGLGRARGKCSQMMIGSVSQRSPRQCGSDSFLLWLPCHYGEQGIGDRSVSGWESEVEAGRERRGIGIALDWRCPFPVPWQWTFWPLPPLSTVLTLLSLLSLHLHLHLSTSPSSFPPSPTLHLPLKQPSFLLKERDQK